MSIQPQLWPPSPSARHQRPSPTEAEDASIGGVHSPPPYQYWFASLLHCSGALTLFRRQPLPVPTATALCCVGGGLSQYRRPPPLVPARAAFAAGRLRKTEKKTGGGGGVKGRKDTKGSLMDSHSDGGDTPWRAALSLFFWQTQRATDRLTSHKRHLPPHRATTPPPGRAGLGDAAPSGGPPPDRRGDAAPEHRRHIPRPGRGPSTLPPRASAVAAPLPPRQVLHAVHLERSDAAAAAAV